MSGGSSGDKKLGQILIELKLVTTSQIADALMVQEQRKIRKEAPLKLGQLLVVMKMITLEQLQGALRQQTQKAEALRKMVIDAKSRDQDNRSITAIRKQLATGFKPHEEDGKERTTWSKFKNLFNKSK